MAASNDKSFKLVERLQGWDGVVAAEAYKKSMSEATYDVLVKTENGQLVEGTIAGPRDLELFRRYVEAVIELSENNFRNYPNLEEL